MIERTDSVHFVSAMCTEQKQSKPEKKTKRKCEKTMTFSPKCVIVFLKRHFKLTQSMSSICDGLNVNGLAFK